MGAWQSASGEYVDFYVFYNFFGDIIFECEAEDVKFVERHLGMTCHIEWKNGQKKTVIADSFKRKTKFVATKKKAVISEVEPPPYTAQSNSDK